MFVLLKVYHLFNILQQNNLLLCSALLMVLSAAIIVVMEPFLYGIAVYDNHALVFSLSCFTPSIYLFLHHCGNDIRTDDALMPLGVKGKSLIRR